MFRRGWLVMTVSALLGAGCEGGGVPDAESAIPEADASTLPLPACERCEDCMEVVPLTTANHYQNDNLAYPDPPPAGGDHHPCWVAFGVYQHAVPAPRWVHNLEHGGVAYLYHCPEGCDLELQHLKKLVEAHPRALLTPYADLPSRFAAVAWGHRLVTHCLDLAQFEEFYDAHADRAPESILSSPDPSLCAWEQWR